MLSQDADKFRGGSYLIIYLAPPDYHRVHAPVTGTITGYNYLPGHLWPVFPVAVRDVRDLFGRNERLLINFKSEMAGTVGLIMVGAFGVGRMEVNFCDVVTNSGGKAEARDFDTAVDIERGAEIGRFNMGSTVIMLFEESAVEFELEKGQVVTMGQRIGKCLAKG
jgi:phosphatidylserine decarboxylase